jgi:hypothetical protein
MYSLCLINISGLCSYASYVTSLYLKVPPSTVAALRTLQVVLAFAAQMVLMNMIPPLLDVVGAVIVVGSALAITFEKKITASVVKLYQGICARRNRFYIAFILRLSKRGAKFQNISFCISKPVVLWDMSSFSV